MIVKRTIVTERLVEWERLVASQRVRWRGEGLVRNLCAGILVPGCTSENTAEDETSGQKGK
jgi:hypothetical protein